MASGFSLAKLVQPPRSAPGPCRLPLNLLAQILFSSALLPTEDESAAFLGFILGLLAFSVAL